MNEPAGSPPAPESSTRSIVKRIEADGWYRIKSKSGHRQYKHSVKPGRDTVPGQMNAELDQKTEKSILKQARLVE